MIHSGQEWIIDQHFLSLDVLFIGMLSVGNGNTGGKGGVQICKSSFIFV